MVGGIVVLIFLGIYCYWDLRDRYLPMCWVLAGLLASFVFAVLNGMDKNNIDLWRIFAGMIPGIMLCLLSWAAKGSVGCGDGFVLMIIGNLIGVKACVLVFLAAVMLSFGYSCLLLVFFKKSRRYSFPFVPFYLLGTVIVGLTTGVG